MSHSTDQKGVKDCTCMNVSMAPLQQWPGDYSLVWAEVWKRWLNVQDTLFYLFELAPERNACAHMDTVLTAAGYINRISYFCLSVPLSACVSVRPSVSLSVFLSVCRPVLPSVCLPACLSVCLPTCLPVCLPTCLSVCLSAYLPACLSVRLSVAVRLLGRAIGQCYPSYSSIHLSIHPFAWPGWPCVSRLRQHHTSHAARPDAVYPLRHGGDPDYSSRPEIGRWADQGIPNETHPEIRGTVVGQRSIQSLWTEECSNSVSDNDLHALRGCEHHKVFRELDFPRGHLLLVRIVHNSGVRRLHHHSSKWSDRRNAQHRRANNPCRAGKIPEHSVVLPWVMYGLNCYRIYTVRFGEESLPCQLSCVRQATPCG